jgi:hypothetical protein
MMSSVAVSLTHTEKKKNREAVSIHALSSMTAITGSQSTTTYPILSEVFLPFITAHR